MSKEINVEEVFSSTQKGSTMNIFTFSLFILCFMNFKRRNPGNLC